MSEDSRTTTYTNRNLEESRRSISNDANILNTLLLELTQSTDHTRGHLLQQGMLQHGYVTEPKPFDSYLVEIRYQGTLLVSRHPLTCRDTKI
jgi:hypothetical protein